MKRLSPSAMATFTVIRRYFSEHGYCPTRQEIASATHFEPSTINSAVEKLIAAGLIERIQPHKRRNLRLVEAGSE